MSGTQFYELQQILNKANDIDTANAELKRNIQEMEDIVNDMKSVWEDATQTRFVQQFNAMQPDLEAFCTNISKLTQRAIQHVEDVKKASGGPA